MGVASFQVDELERKCKTQQEQLFQVKEDLTHTTAALKVRAVQAEGEFALSGTNLESLGKREKGGSSEDLTGSLLCLSPERLEMEKRRFRQGLEDAESLRLKEVRRELLGP